MELHQSHFRTDDTTSRTIDAFSRQSPTDIALRLILQFEGQRSSCIGSL